MDKIAAHIEALLFAEGGSLTFKALAKALGVKENDLAPALDALEQQLEGGEIGRAHV